MERLDTHSYSFDGRRLSSQTMLTPTNSRFFCTVSESSARSSVVRILAADGIRAQSSQSVCLRSGSKQRRTMWGPRGLLDLRDFWTCEQGYVGTDCCVTNRTARLCRAVKSDDVSVGYVSSFHCRTVLGSRTSMAEAPSLMKRPASTAQVAI